MARDVDEKILRVKGLGRFQVMALLQAARYYVAYEKNREKAKSFGLSRAIFYAWAKHYGPHRYPTLRLRGSPVLGATGRNAGKEGEEKRCPEGFREVLGECVEVTKRGYYAIGGEELLPWRFDREVTRRLLGLIDPEKAWQAAVEYVSSFPRSVLENPTQFYKKVYEPVRDTFFKLLLKGELPRPEALTGRATSEESRDKGRGEAARRELPQKTLDQFFGKKTKS